MNTQNAPVDGLKAEWRHAFRQHCLDIEPDLGVEPRACLELASHWIFGEPPLAAMVARLAADQQELDRWTANADAAQPRQRVIERLGLVNSRRPVGTLAWIVFMVKFAGACLREQNESLCGIGRAKSRLRPRAARA